MEVLYWVLIASLFLIGFIGLVYPIIPSVLFIIGGMVLYGILFDFEQLGLFFWIIQGMFVLLLLFADYVSNLIGVKRFGGTKAGMWGSTVGLLAGPFVIPVFGILIGPFVGAVAAELIVHRRSLWDSVKVGLGSLIGFITSAVTKFVIQALMIGYFLFEVL
ncbi:MAG: DUF456 domain-containing protein [Bacillus sp. (in: firmicutes)]